MSRSAIDLEAAILVAHAVGDGFALCDLYREAAELKLVDRDENAAGFLFTQAYVFGLEAGHPVASDLCAILQSMGREAKT